MTAWMTKREAADYLRVSTRTIERMVRDGKLQKHTVAGSRSVRFSSVEVRGLLRPEEVDEEDAWLAEFERQAREEAAWAEGRAPTPEAPYCPLPRCNNQSGPPDCDHVWCADCNNWIKDSGFGPKCGHRWFDNGGKLRRQAA